MKPQQMNDTASQAVYSLNQGFYVSNIHYKDHPLNLCSSDSLSSLRMLLRIVLLSDSTRKPSCLLRTALVSERAHSSLNMPN